MKIKSYRETPKPEETLMLAVAILKMKCHRVNINTPSSWMVDGEELTCQQVVEKAASLEPKGATKDFQKDLVKYLEL